MADVASNEATVMYLEEACEARRRMPGEFGFVITLFPSNKILRHASSVVPCLKQTTACVLEKLAELR
jgi:hypothetical protein